MTQAQAMHLPQAYRREFAGFGATVREIVSTLTTEQTLALRASTKAALPRQNLTELRAMYAPSSE
jgi:TfoX/Sxy family transcriptional regulator of competence genes